MKLFTKVNADSSAYSGFYGGLRPRLAQWTSD